MRRLFVLRVRGYMGRFIATWLAVFAISFASISMLHAEEQQRWTVSLNDVGLRVLVTQIAEITGKNYIIEPDLKGNVTIVSNTPLDQKGVEQLFMSVLSVHGYVAVPTEHAIIIKKRAGAAREALPVELHRGAKHSAGYQVITKVINIKFVSVQDILSSVAAMVGDKGGVQAISNANALILHDTAENIQRILEVVNHLDVPEGGEVEIITLQENWVGTVMPLLEKLIPREIGVGQDEGIFHDVRVVADERTNSIILKGDPYEIKRVKSYILLLDQPAKENGHTRVIYLKHADAESTATILKQLIQETITNNEQKTSFSIQADKAINALVVRAEPHIMAEIRTLVNQLDIRRLQVLIEAAIVEITDDSDLDTGVQFGTQDASVDADYSATSFSNVGSSLTSFLSTLGASGIATLSDGATLTIGNRGDFSVLVQALATSNKADLLSTPSITTLDNEEAEIVVGQNVPFRTGTFDTDGDGTNPFTTITREDIGITLKVTPQILAGDLVRLAVEQEVSSVEETTQTGAADLITSKRTINTTILADNKATIVLGGLIRDDVSESESKVPLLGDVPIVGNLFKSQTESYVKRNLVVFLRPTILESKEDVKRLSHRKYDGIWELNLKPTRENKPIVKTGTEQDFRRLYVPKLEQREKTGFLHLLEDRPTMRSTPELESEPEPTAPISVEFLEPVELDDTEAVPNDDGAALFQWPEGGRDIPTPEFLQQHTAGGTVNHGQ